MEENPEETKIWYIKYYAFKESLLAQLDSYIHELGTFPVFVKEKDVPGSSLTDTIQRFVEKVRVTLETEAITHASDCSDAELAKECYTIFWELEEIDHLIYKWQKVAYASDPPSGADLTKQRSISDRILRKIKYVIAFLKDKIRPWVRNRYINQGEFERVISVLDLPHFSHNALIVGLHHIQTNLRQMPLDKLKEVWGGLQLKLYAFIDYVETKLDKEA